MAYKFLTRLGFLTGVLLYTTHIGVWAEPDVAYELTERVSRQLKEIANSSGSRYGNTTRHPVFDYCFVAQQDYNNAIKRGIYFAYRMPDWTSEFLKHTNEILDENEFKEGKNDIHRSRDNHSSLASEDNALGHRIDIVCNPDEYSPVNIKGNRSIKLPKIKDDITCGKRVLA